MAGERRELRIILNIPDSDHLPKGIYCDDVAVHFTEELERFVAKWYGLHPGLVEWEPDIC